MKILWYRRKQLIVLAAILVMMAGITTLLVSEPLPSFLEVKTSYHPSDIWVVDRHGSPLASVRTGMTERSLPWVHLKELSPEIISILLKAEDKRFFEHFGVDPIAIGNAIKQGLAGGRWRGASTLTMQLVHLVARANGPKKGSWIRKLRQMYLALRLESDWSKEQILEAYVNLVSFRGELKGLRAATLAFFAKSPSGLREDEAALLIALLRAPNAMPDVVATRACALLNTGSCLSVQYLVQKHFGGDYVLARDRHLLPILAHEFVTNPSSESNEDHGELITTSLDSRIQRLAVELLRDNLLALRGQNVRDGAVLVLRTQTGEVLAYVGNGGPGAASAFQVDGVKTRRQAGSTIKPFIYAAAMEDGRLESTSLLEDSPINISLGDGKVYRPRNYDQKFRGLVSAAEALGSSLNVPAIKVLGMIGETKALALLRELGVSKLADDDFYGHSLALGTVDITLWELTHAYRQLGVSSTALSDKTRAKIFNILAAPEYRRFTFGLDSVLAQPFPTAVKTGTSQDMRDNWCIGWNDEYTVGVWVGNFDGQPMWHVSGVSGAAPVWHRLMGSLVPKKDQPVPTYQHPEARLNHRVLTRIRYPTPNMLVALDPEIPKESQKLNIEIENPQNNQHIFVNEKRISHSQPLTFWSVQRGRHQVELRAHSGEVLDRVTFDVR
jgi:penicillin-binding protein 1C